MGEGMWYKYKRSMSGRSSSGSSMKRGGIYSEVNVKCKCKSEIILEQEKKRGQRQQQLIRVKLSNSN
jgi:hypothetical protein